MRSAVDAEDDRSARFGDRELQYLLGVRRLGRLATADAEGRPRVVPVGWPHDPQLSEDAPRQSHPVRDARR